MSHDTVLRAELPAMPSRDDAQAAARRLGNADDYVTRVLDIAGARAFALDAFLRVSRVEWSAEVATACVECADRPRLLLNAAFVERRCTTPERLATLLLHELAHVSMGHTRMFPRPTVAHNIACDAIINREIAALAWQQAADVNALTALLVECYPAHESPWFLLRPPPGWPHHPDWQASAGAMRTLRDIHRTLYDPQELHLRHTVQYADIVDALREAEEQSAGRAGDEGHSKGGDSDTADAHDGNDGFPTDCSALLGGHGATPEEQRALTGGRDVVGGEVFADAMRAIGGRFAGSGGDEVMHQVAKAARRATLERALTALLRRCGSTDGGNRRVEWDVHPTRSPMPHRDRRAPARVALARVLGAPRPLLFADEMQRPRAVARRATIYLDTSGSMNGVLPVLHTSLVALRKQLAPRILLFSTIIAEANGADFDAGRLCTTGGTDIEPVITHAVQEARVAASVGRSATRMVVVLTDGHFSAPKAHLVRQLQECGITVHLGVIGGGPLHDNEQWVASSARLPSL